jgi:hypothetical protein
MTEGRIDFGNGWASLAKNYWDLSIVSEHQCAIQKLLLAFTFFVSMHIFFRSSFMLCSHPHQLPSIPINPLQVVSWERLNPSH